MNSVIGVIDIIFRLLTIVVVVDVILSYFLSPYNNFRIFLDRIVNPMLVPIRRIVPPVQMIDFSPIVLLILIQVLESLLLSILSRMG